MADAASLIDWLRDSSPWEIIGYATALVLALNRGMDVAERFAKALERVGKAPDQVRAWLERRANRLLNAEREREALQRLIANSEAILAQVTKNGSASMFDAVTRIETKLDAHLAEQPPLLEEHRDMMARVAALEGKI